MHCLVLRHRHCVEWYWSITVYRLFGYIPALLPHIMYNRVASEISSGLCVDMGENEQASLVTLKQVFLRSRDGQSPEKMIG